MSGHVSVGEERALRTLLTRERGGLELVCLLMLGDRASADCALADAAVAAWDQVGGRDPRTPARIWLYRLALRACSDLDPGHR